MKPMLPSPYAPRGAPDRELLARLASTGAPLREIAAEIDRSVTTVRYWLGRWGIKRRDARRTRVDPATAPPQILRRCSAHGDMAFRLDARGTYRCPLCSQEQVSRRRRRVKRILIEEAGGRCVLCGYDRCPAALQFHHRDPADKAFGLASGGVTRAIDLARAEARKCVLLCANCHAEVEAGYRPLEAVA